jgi:hypothetical protein
MRGTIPSLPNTSSWRGAYLNSEYFFTAWYLVKHREFTYLQRRSGGKRAAQKNRLGDKDVDG